MALGNGMTVDELLKDPKKLQAFVDYVNEGKLTMTLEEAERMLAELPKDTTIGDIAKDKGLTTAFRKHIGAIFQKDNKTALKPSRSTPTSEADNVALMAGLMRDLSYANAERDEMSAQGYTAGIYATKQLLTQDKYEEYMQKLYSASMSGDVDSIHTIKDELKDVYGIETREKPVYHTVPAGETPLEPHEHDIPSGPVVKGNGKKPVKAVIGNALKKIVALALAGLVVLGMIVSLHAFIRQQKSNDVSTSGLPNQPAQSQSAVETTPDTTLEESTDDRTFYYAIDDEEQNKMGDPTVIDHLSELSLYVNSAGVMETMSVEDLTQFVGHEINNILWGYGAKGSIGRSANASHLLTGVLYAETGFNVSGSNLTVEQVATAMARVKEWKQNSTSTSSLAQKADGSYIMENLVFENKTPQEVHKECANNPKLDLAIRAVLLQSEKTEKFSTGAGATFSVLEYKLGESNMARAEKMGIISYVQNEHGVVTEVKINPCALPTADDMQNKTTINAYCQKHGFSSEAEMRTFVEDITGAFNFTAKALTSASIASSMGNTVLTSGEKQGYTSELKSKLDANSSTIGASEGIASKDGKNAITTTNSYNNHSSYIALDGVDGVSIPQDVINQYINGRYQVTPDLGM